MSSHSKLPEIDVAQKRSAFETAPQPSIKKVQPEDIEEGGGSMIMDSPKKSDRVVNLANQTKEEQSLINVTADGLLEKGKKSQP